MLDLLKWWCLAFYNGAAYVLGIQINDSTEQGPLDLLEAGREGGGKCWAPWKDPTKY